MSTPTSAEFPHVPQDVKVALDNFAANVTSGTITPWHATTWPLERMVPTEGDAWLSEYAAGKLPEMER